MARKVRADMILRQVARRHIGRITKPDDVFLTEVVNGKSWGQETLRMDAMAIRKSWANPCVTVYEIKVSRSDFTSDDKWPGYLNYCNEFYFACPNGLIEKDELSPEIGLIHYNPEKNSIRTVKKAVYRQIEIPTGILWYIIFSRVNADNQHPFFSSTREMLEAWVEDKKTRNELGYSVINKTFRTIYDLEEQVKKLESQIGVYEKEHKTLSAIQEIAGRAGCNWTTNGDVLIEFFKQSLKAGVPKRANQLINDIKRAVERLETAL